MYKDYFFPGHSIKSNVTFTMIFIQILFSCRERNKMSEAIDMTGDLDNGVTI